MYYQVWRTDERTHAWALFTFANEAKGKILHYTKSNPITLYYESENIISMDLFEKNGLSYVILINLPNFNKL